MGTDSPAAGGDSKPDVNNNNDNTSSRGRNKNKSKHRNSGMSGGAANFKGAITELPIFSANQGNSAITKFNATVDSIVHYASVHMNSWASDTIRFGVLTLPPDVDRSKYITKDEKGVEDYKSPVHKDDYNSDRNVARKLRGETTEGLRKLYRVVLGQCDPEVDASLREDPAFTDIDKKSDVLKLLEKIKAICLQKDSTVTDPILTLYKTIKDVFTCKQNDNESLEAYYKRLTDTIKASNTAFGEDGGVLEAFKPQLIDIICAEKGEVSNSLSEDKKEERMKEGVERMKAVLLLQGGKREVYAELNSNLRADYIKGAVASYPTTPNKGFALMRTVKPKARKPPPNTGELGHSFNTNGDESGGGRSNNGNRPTCPRCGHIGHTEEQCKAKKHVDGTMLLVEEEFEISDMERDGFTEGQGDLEVMF